MSGKLWVLLLLGVLVGACAKPKYAPDTGRREGKPDATGAPLECQARFKSSGLCLTWAWEQEPTSNSPGRLIFKTFQWSPGEQGALKTDTASVPDVVLWMPSMGHGSSPTHTVRIETGTYQSSKVFFVMPGEWEIRFQVKNGTEILDEARIQYTF